MIVQKIRSARRSNRGMTLVEVMVALVIILVLMLGLIQTAILSIDNNLRNVFRDEAARIADQTMGDLRSFPFNDAALTATGNNCVNGTNARTEQRNFRDILNKPFTVCWIIKDLTTDTKSFRVLVGWNHKRENPLQAPTNTEFQHIVNSMMRQ